MKLFAIVVAVVILSVAVTHLTTRYYQPKTTYPVLIIDRDTVVVAEREPLNQ